MCCQCLSGPCIVHIDAQVVCSLSSIWRTFAGVGLKTLAYLTCSCLCELPTTSMLPGCAYVPGSKGSGTCGKQWMEVEMRLVSVRAGAAIERAAMWWASVGVPNAPR